MKSQVTNCCIIARPGDGPIAVEDAVRLHRYALIPLELLSEDELRTIGKRQATAWATSGATAPGAGAMSAETQGLDAATMEAGRETDALIAERVMGAVWMNAGDPDYELLRFAPEEYTLATRERATGRLVSYGEAWDDECLPYYSTEIAAAWEVVERMRKLGIHVSVGPCAGWYGWAAQANRSRPYVHCHESAETASLAICRAALLATAGEAHGGPIPSTPTGPRAPGE